MLNKRTLLLLLVVLIVAGALLRLFPIRTSFHYWDETVYLQHAEIFAGLREDNFNEFDIRPPLLPAILAVGFLVWHSPITAHVIVAVLASIGIPLTYLLSQRLFKDDRVSIVAAALFAFAPLHVWLSGDILVDSILPVLWLLTIWLLVVALEKQDHLFASAAGFAFGLSVLMKFTSLSLGIVIIAALLLYRAKIKTYLAVIFASLLTAAPYFIWVWQTHGSPWYTLELGYKVVNWDTPTNPLLFLIEYPYLAGLIGLFGLAAFAFYAAKNRELTRPQILLIIAGFTLFIVSQQLVHKEIRVLLPTLPFVMVIASQGLIRHFDKRPKAVTMLVFLAVAQLVILAPVRPTISDALIWEKENLGYSEFGLLIEQWQPAAMQTALWLRNVEPGTVWTNYNYPILGYYSKQNIQVPVAWETLLQEIEANEGKDYVVWNYDAPTNLDERFYFLETDPRFVEIASFNDTRSRISVFEFVP
jgi:4-amino-4-deoxy-L-arabinose transferase-like glycosyltransferase